MFHVKHYFSNTYNKWIVLKHFISFYGYEMHCTHKNLFIYTFETFLLLQTGIQDTLDFQYLSSLLLTGILHTLFILY